MSHTKKSILYQSPYISVGFVTKIEGSIVSVGIDRDLPFSNILYEGKIIEFPKLHNYILIPYGSTNLVGKIINIYGYPEYNSNEVKLKNNLVNLPFPVRSLMIEIVGFLNYDAQGAPISLEYSIAALPTVGDSVLLPRYEDIKCVMTNITEEEKKEITTISLGSNLLEPSFSIDVELNKLIGYHLGIVGNTGSGKSCSLVHIVRSILEKHKSLDRSLDIILFDAHGEYKECFDELEDEHTTIIKYDQADGMPWCHLLLMDGEDLTELLGLTSGLQDTSLESHITETIENLKKTPIATLKNSIAPLRQNEMNTSVRDTLVRNLNRIKIKLETAHPDKKFLTNFLQSPNYSSGILDHKEDGKRTVYIKQFMNPSYSNDAQDISNSSKQCYLHIIDLQVVSSIYHQLFIGFILKNFLKRQKLQLVKNRSVIVIADEAHQYVSHSGAKIEDLPYCQQQFSYLAKEGRKFGMHMVLATQKPSDINPQIFSQCNSFIIHRLVNYHDRRLISNVINDASESILGFLPLLGQREALFCGQAARIPQYVKMQELSKEQRPKSQTPNIFTDKREK